MSDFPAVPLVLDWCTNPYDSGVMKAKAQSLHTCDVCSEVSRRSNSHRFRTLCKAHGAAHEQGEAL